MKTSYELTGQGLFTITLKVDKQDQVQRISMQGCPYLIHKEAKQHLLSILKDAIQLLEDED